ncbi:PepSY-like domain-containing protein [Porphyromonas sp.]
MKRILSLTLALIALVSLGLYAANDRVIQSKQLPKAAQLFLAKHFAGRAVSLAKEDRDFSGTTYDVRLADGTELEFTSAGAWKEVDGNHTALPLTFIPAQLVKTIQSQHAGDAIVHIERKRRGYQVELASGLELLFDTRFQLVGYDD